MMSLDRPEFKTEDNFHYIKNEDDGSYVVKSPTLSFTNEEIMVYHNNVDRNRPHFIEKDFNKICKKDINSLLVDTEKNNNKIKIEENYGFNNSEPLMYSLKIEPEDVKNDDIFQSKDSNIVCKKHINSLQVDTENNNNKIKIEENYGFNNSEPLMYSLKIEPEDVKNDDIFQLNANVFKEENLFSDNLKLKIEYEDEIIKIEKSVPEDNIVFDSKIEIEKNEMYTVLNENKYNIFNDSELSDLPIKNKLVHNSNIIDKNKNICEKSIYICDSCHQSFKSKRTLISHIKNIHSLNHCFSNNRLKYVCSKSSKRKQLQKTGVKKTFSCKVCLKQFSDQSNCNRHMKNHCHMRNNVYLNEKKFKCNICMKTFTRESNLKIHSRIHTGVAPYECELCSLKFHRNDALKAHRRSHTDKYSFHCSECRRSFTYSNTLLRHVKMKHQNEKQYVCGYCQLSFFRKQSLIIHIRSKHTGERPYKCGICKKSFMEKKVLVDHKKLHSKK